MTDPVRRIDFGRVCVFFGEKSGKYPDGNQLVVRGTDTRAAFAAKIDERSERLLAQHLDDLVAEGRAKVDADGRYAAA